MEGKEGIRNAKPHASGVRNLTQVSVFHGFPFVKMKMRRFAPVRGGGANTHGFGPNLIGPGTSRFLFLRFWPSTSAGSRLPPLLSWLGVNSTTCVFTSQPLL